MIKDNIKRAETYYNISVSPNDGGIALGQAYAASFLDGEIPS